MSNDRCRRLVVMRLRWTGRFVRTLALLATVVVLGCQTAAMPTSAAGPTAAVKTADSDAKAVAEARPAPPSVSRNAFVPPPRTISDITAILDQQKRDKPEVEAADRQRAEQSPPDSKDPATLARFYRERAGAALKVGRSRQAIEDLTPAVGRVAQAPDARALEMQIRWSLYGAEIQAGSYTRAIAVLELSQGAVAHSYSRDHPAPFRDLARDASRPVGG